MLQGHCLEPRLDHLPLESHHAKFQVNPLWNGWDIVNSNICTGWRWGWWGYKVIIMPLCGPNWLSQVWHWPGQLGWGQSVAKTNIFPYSWVSLEVCFNIYFWCHGFILCHIFESTLHLSKFLFDAFVKLWLTSAGRAASVPFTTQRKKTLIQCRGLNNTSMISISGHFSK